MWPKYLDLSEEECLGILRKLELEAYSSVVSALRAQGELTKERRKVLHELSGILNVPIDRHKAEIRRAVNDEQLSTIAARIGGTNSCAEWAREGRRIIPLLRRGTPITRFTGAANRAKADLEAAARDKKLLPPAKTVTSKKPARKSSEGPPLLDDILVKNNKDEEGAAENRLSVKPPNISVPKPPAAYKAYQDYYGGDVVVLPSGMAIRVINEEVPPAAKPAAAAADKSTAENKTAGSAGNRKRKSATATANSGTGHGGPATKMSYEVLSRPLPYPSNMPPLSGAPHLNHYPPHPPPSNHPFKMPHPLPPHVPSANSSFSQHWSQNKGGKQGGLPPNPTYPGQHLIGGFPPPPAPPSAPLPGTSMATITKKPRRASTAGGRAKKPKAEKAPRKTTQQQQQHQHQINWQNQLAIAQMQQGKVPASNKLPQSSSTSANKTGQCAPTSQKQRPAMFPPGSIITTPSGTSLTSTTKTAIKAVPVNKNSSASTPIHTLHPLPPKPQPKMPPEAAESSKLPAEQSEDLSRGSPPAPQQPPPVTIPLGGKTSHVAAAAPTVSQPVPGVGKSIKQPHIIRQPSSVKKPVAKPDINTSTNGPSTAKTKAPVVSSAGATTVATSGTPVQTNPAPLKLKDQPMATLVTTTGMKVIPAGARILPKTSSTGLMSTMPAGTPIYMVAATGASGSGSGTPNLVRVATASSSLTSTAQSTTSSSSSGAVISTTSGGHPTPPPPRVVTLSAASLRSPGVVTFAAGARLPGALRGSAPLTRATLQSRSFATAVGGASVPRGGLSSSKPSVIVVQRSGTQKATILGKELTKVIPSSTPVAGISASSNVTVSCPITPSTVGTPSAIKPVVIMQSSAAASSSSSKPTATPLATTSGGVSRAVVGGGGGGGGGGSVPSNHPQPSNVIVLDVSQEQLQRQQQQDAAEVAMEEQQQQQQLLDSQLANTTSSVLSDILQATGITDINVQDESTNSANEKGQFEVIDGPGLDPQTQHHQRRELIPDPSAQAAAILAEEAASITSVAEGLVFDSRPSQAQSVIVERTGSVDDNVVVGAVDTGVVGGGGPHSHAPLDIVASAFANADLAATEHCELRPPGFPTEFLKNILN